jgi:hypothetical protein
MKATKEQIDYVNKLCLWKDQPKIPLLEQMESEAISEIIDELKKLKSVKKDDRQARTVAPVSTAPEIADQHTAKPAGCYCSKTATCSVCKPKKERYHPAKVGMIQKILLEKAVNPTGYAKEEFVRDGMILLELCDALETEAQR